MPNFGTNNLVDLWRNNMGMFNKLGDKSIDKQTIKIFWRAILQDKKNLLLTIPYPIGGILLSTGVPYFISKLISGAVAKTPSEPYVAGLLLVSILGVLGNRLGFRAFMKLQAGTMARLEELAFNNILRRSAGFHADNVGGKLVSDINDYPEAFNKLSGAVIATIIPFFLILVSGTTVVTIQSPILGVVIGIMSIFAISAGIWDSRKRGPIRKARLRLRKLTVSHIADTVMNVQTAKIFASEDRELESHKKFGGDLMRVRQHDWASASNQGNNKIAILMSLQIIFILVAISAMEDNIALLTASIFGLSFMTMIVNRLFETTQVIRAIDDSLLDASPITSYLMQELEIKDKSHAATLKYNKGEVKFDDVWFRYSDAKKNDHVFSSLNLDIAPGEHIGLVGPSGGGKSTLTKLLLRFDDLKAGSISIDDQNIADVSQASLRQTVSYVPQEPLLFHRTIKENIAYGRPNASLHEIKDAARKANAHDFIKALPQGYNTIVGERGVKLSGGQRQRIAIARAILKDSPILVLDEATSALDSESESLIQSALWKLIEGKTALVVAHRLSTIQKMDRIIVLSNGEIIEQGSHKDLLNNDGLYAKLWSHQSGGFISE